MSGLLQLVAEAQTKKPVSVATHEQAEMVTGSATECGDFIVDRLLTVQQFTNLYDVTGRGVKTGTCREVLAALGVMHPLVVKPNDEPKFHKTKSQAPLFNAAVYAPETPGGANRADGTWQRGYWAVVGDADALTPDQLEAFETQLAQLGWVYLKTTSFKHTETAPRVRYVLPMDRDGSADEYLRGWEALNDLAGGDLDPKAKDPTRRSYFPSCPHGEEPNRPPAVIKGERLATWGELVSLAPEPSKGAKPRVTTPESTQKAEVAEIFAKVRGDVTPTYDNTPADAELVANACSMMGCFRETGDPDKASGDVLWRLAAGVLHHCIGTAGVFHDWSAKDARYDRAQAQQKFDGWKVEAPPRCATIESSGWAGCKTCVHRERDSTPVMFGRVTNTPHKDDPNKTLALERAAESGALCTVVDQDGGLNYVETYTKDGRVCRQVIKGGTEAATDLILTVASAGGGKAPSQQAIAVFEAKLRTAAKREGTVTPLAMRVAQVGDTRFVDLGPGRIVEITPHGWSLTDESEHVPLFRRGAGAGELPDPVPFDGDSKAAFAACIRHFSEMFQTPLEQAVVRTAVVLDQLDPETTQPVCEYVGPAGSGKSTAAEHDVGLIDPPSKKGLRTCGFKTEDIAAASQQQYVLAIDNASRFDKTTSDTLCISSTGGTLVVRKFHAQTEIAALHLLRPVVVTAVSPVCIQPDLQTRTLRFEFRPNQTGEILGEDEIRAMTAVRLPALLGALYTLKAGTLRVLPEVRQRKGWSHRLITFDQTGEAMLCAAGYQPGAFIKIIGAMRESMARRSASGDVFLLKVCAALSVVCKWAMDDTEPTARQVLTRPREAAVFETTSGLGAVMRPGVLLSLMPRPDPWDRDSPIPKTVRALMDALRRVQPTLRAMGVAYSEATYGTRALLRFDWRPSDLDGLEGGA